MKRRGKKGEPMPDTPEQEPEQNEEEEIGILCMRVDMMPAMIGSVKKECSYCKTPVWLSHATDASTAKYPHRKLICMQCAPQHMKQDAKLKPPTPAQLTELRDYFRRKDEERN
jgi:superfamily II helicase